MFWIQKVCDCSIVKHHTFVLFIFITTCEYIFHITYNKIDNLYIYVYIYRTSDVLGYNCLRICRPFLL